MVFTLFCARDRMLEDTDLIIAYGDIVYEPRVLQALMGCDAPMGVVVDQEWRRFWDLRMADPLSDAETLKIDSKGMITELGRKPRSYDEIQGQYIGLIKVRWDRVVELCRLYDAMDPDRSYDGRDRKQMYLTSFIQHAIDNGWPVQAVPVSNGWLEVDTLAELQLYRRMMAEGTLDGFFRITKSSSGSAH
jgi:choline kinase